MPLRYYYPLHDARNFPFTLMSHSSPTSLNNLLSFSVIDCFTFYNMLVFVLIPTLAARQTISEVFTGHWDGTISYSSQTVDAEPIHLDVVRSVGPNYLETIFNDELVQINLSFVNLSGNITYMDKIYDFDFTMKAPPFVSTDIDLQELGLLHITLATYTNIHAIYMDGEKVISLLFNKFVPPVQGSWLWNFIVTHKKGIFGGGAIIVVQLIFRTAVGRLQRNAAIEMAKKRAEEAKKKKEEEDAKEAEEDKEEEEHKEEEGQEVEKELVPDENGKVKTD